MANRRQIIRDHPGHLDWSWICKTGTTSHQLSFSEVEMKKVVRDFLRDIEISAIDYGRVLHRVTDHFVTSCRQCGSRKNVLYKERTQCQACYARIRRKKK